MGKLFQVLTIVLAGFHGVHDTETALGPGNGLTKKMKVIDTVGMVASTVGMSLGVPVPPVALDKAISGMVDSFVTLFNFFGVFKHSSAPPAA